MRILLLAKFEDHDITKGNENGAAEEGDTVEESEGMISGEKPNRAGLQPGAREVFFVIVEQIPFLKACFGSGI